GAQLKVAIIGCGYVGLPLALRFAEAGHKVTGFDTDPHKVSLLNAGKSYIEHIPQTKIQQFVNSRHFNATTDFARLKEVDAILICVPTPLDARREPALCAASVWRTSRTGFELRGANGHLRLSPLAEGAVGGPGVDHLSRHHGGIGAAHPRKERLALSDCRWSRKRKCGRRLFPGVFSGTRGSGKQAIWARANSQGSRRRESTKRPGGSVAVCASGCSSRAGQLDARSGNGQ